MISKFFKFIAKHKIIFGVSVVIIIAAGYFGIKAMSGNKAETKYVLTSVEKGTIISSISGSGQVSASSQIDIKPKVSGDVISVDVKKGQKVNAGDIIVKLDSTDAYRTLRDSRLSLETAQLSMDKLKLGATESAIQQAKNSLTNAQTSLDKLKLSQETNYQNALNTQQKSEDNIEKAYEDAYNSISSAFLDLPSVITELYTVFFSTDLIENERGLGSNMSNDIVLINTILADDWKERGLISNYIDDINSKYQAAKLAYDNNFVSYKASSRNSSNADIDKLLTLTIDTSKKISDTVQSEINVLKYWVDYRTTHKLPIYNTITQYQNSLGADTTQVNSIISSLLSAQRSIKDYIEARDNAVTDLKSMEINNPLDLAAAQATVAERQTSLDDLLAGADPLEIKTQELSLQQRINSLADAQENLANYTVRAPFDGVIAAIDIKPWDTLSSGSAAATLITEQKMAEISLNEVDVAKVKVGQKVTLTFDAVSDLTISGEVADVDIIGTVSQGVVTYNVKILFDTQDERVRPGMSVSAAIITDIKQDVLTVPNAAVKTSGNISYVEMPAENVAANLLNNNSGITLTSALKQQSITTGIANDSLTEVVDGLQAGDQVVSRTISSTTSSTTTSQGQSLFNMGGGGTRAFRAP